MTRSALPQNWLINNGTLIEEMDSLTDWVVSPNVVLDTANYKFGSASIRITTGAGTSADGKKVINWNFKNNKFIGFWLYLNTDVSTIFNVTIYMSSTANLSKYMNCVVSATEHNLTNGWVFVTLNKEDWTLYHGESWDNNFVMLRYNVIPKSGQIASISIDNVYEGIQRKPKCLLTFDGAHEGWYTNGYSYMVTKGIRGTQYVQSETVGLDGIMSLAQLATVYQNGILLGNHTTNHAILNVISTGEVASVLQGCTDWLLVNGFNRGAYHVAYPGGARSATVDGVMADLGMLTGRSVSNNLQETPPVNIYNLRAYDIHKDVTLATAKSYIDTSIVKEAIIIILLHDIVDTPAARTEWATADFQALIDYIIERGIECITVDEYYEGMTNPRYRSIPLSRATI